MITINNLTMGFSQRTLFKDISFSIFKNEKIGLTGPNGAGKTTLFTIILGQTQAVAGNIQIQKGINIGYLPQEAKFTSTRTVLEELTSGDDRIRKLNDEKHKLEEENKADTDRYGDILHELEGLGIYDLEHKAEKILMGLGFKPAEYHKPIVQLSGGWQMRTLLAKLLTYSYDLILLDEPTNYLDLEATLWLKDYLTSYEGSLVLISHDRVFLNDVTNYTIVLDQGKMTKIKGNYEAYELQKEQNLKSLGKQKNVVDKKREQLERFTERFHAQPNKASAVRNKMKMLERLDEIELPQDYKSVGDFEFNANRPSGYVVATLQNVSKSYGDKQVYKNFDFEIIKGQKVCLVGVNGAGKSTLLKIISKAIPIDEGEVKYGYQVDAGYFSQTRTDVLNPERTVFDEAVSAAPHGTQATRVRTLLGLFNYHGDDVFKTVKVLSGGEKSRLILAKLILSAPNFMLLDEPTTHLDLDGVKAITQAMKTYDGTICFISHDLYFIKEIADHIVEVDNGQVKVYSGGLDYYLDKKKGMEIDQKNAAKKDAQGNAQKQFNVSNEQYEENERLRNINKQHQEAKKRITQIKTEIRNLEQEQKDLEMESYVKSRQLSQQYDRKDPETLKEIGKRLKDIQTRQREIETTLVKIKEERDRISK